MNMYDCQEQLCCLQMKLIIKMGSEKKNLLKLITKYLFAKSVLPLGAYVM